MSWVPLCALHLLEDATDEVSAVTMVVMVPVCAQHVRPAMERAGFGETTQYAGVVEYLEAVDPNELQKQAVELVTDFSEGSTGRAFLSVLIAGAR